MKTSKKIVLSIGVFILILSFLVGKSSLVPLIVLVAAVWILNWSFDQFMPAFAVGWKRKMLKKLF